MITKAFELRANVTQFVTSPSVRLSKETLVPVSSESSVPSFSFSHRLDPFISFYGIFHGDTGDRTVVISNDHDTVYLWVVNGKKLTYRCKGAVISLDGALATLAKEYLTNDKLQDSVVGAIIGNIVREWLFTTAGLKLDWTLAGKWRKEFVFFQVTKETWNTTSISFTPFGKTSFHSDLKTHPLDEVNPADAPSSKIK